MVQIANAPCSWGVIEGIEGDRAGWVRVVDEMQETGYAGTELGDWGFMPTDPDELRRELYGRGLALIGSWVSVNLEDRGEAPGLARTTPSAPAGSWRGSAARRPSSCWATTRTATPTGRGSPGGSRPTTRCPTSRVEGLRRRRQPRRPPGHGRGRDPDRRPPAHRHAHRDRGRGPSPVRDDRPVRPGPVPRHRPLDLRRRWRPGRGRPGVPRPRLARPLQGLRPGGDGGLAGERSGTARRRSATASSASSARAAWTSRA